MTFSFIKALLNNCSYFGGAKDGHFSFFERSHKIWLTLVSDFRKEYEIHKMIQLSLTFRQIAFEAMILWNFPYPYVIWVKSQFTIALEMILDEYSELKTANTP